jgi:hypothetical protein
MLDNPEKTARLMATLKAAVPFEVELMPSAIALLRAQDIADNVKLLIGAGSRRRSAR